MKKALCVGINNYPGFVNDLNGCVNDANDWAAMLEYAGFQTTIILNEQATRQALRQGLENLITSAGPGDEIVFTYSGHGTSVIDTSGDEADRYDEALSVYDGTLLDDELRAIIQKMHPAAHLVVISDSCFSGTVTRALNSDTEKPRYIQTDIIPPRAKLKRQFLADEDMVEILISGCSDSEYSYDGEIDGRWNGVMTAYATSVMRKGQTWQEFFQLLRSYLPSDKYPQTPQLEGSEANKNRVVFATNTAPLPKPPSEDGTGVWFWIKKYWWVMALVVVAGIVIWRVLLS